MWNAETTKIGSDSAGFAHNARTTFRRTLIVCLTLALTLLGVGLAASLIGSERLPVGASLCAIFGGDSVRCGLTPEQGAILLDLRVPRILLAASVGASLAAAGAGYQALLRNPLAEPYLLGISNGAAVGQMTRWSSWGNSIDSFLMAFAGGSVPPSSCIGWLAGPKGHRLKR